MLDLPDRITPDPIAEALCEIRFSSHESEEVPEVALGKLTQNPRWKSFKVVRLPISDIPAPIRLKDANLKHQPSLELRAPGGAHVVKVGVNVASFHQLAPYPGWPKFKSELVDFIEFTFSALRVFECSRIGFRYINTMSESKHGVTGVKDFNLSVLIDGNDIEGPVNLNYIIPRKEKLDTLVRVASPAFVSAPGIAELSALIDIDVYTKKEDSFTDSKDAIDWIEDAHAELKLQFFRLFTRKMMNHLGGSSYA